MKAELSKVNERLIEILGPKRAYFGRVSTLGQEAAKYEYIGYELSEDILPTLEAMSESQLTNLKKVMTYFELHAHSLKKILTAEDEFYLSDFFSSIAWSQFMTIIMFGMLEIATKIQSWASFNHMGSLKDKGKQIKRFLEENLSDDIKKNIVDKYTAEKLFKQNKKIKTFDDVVEHLWCDVRSGFIHDASLQATKLEPYKLSGIGSKEDPLKFTPQATMHELLKTSWEAILKSYGYSGKLNYPRIK